MIEDIALAFVVTVIFYVIRLFIINNIIESRLNIIDRLNIVGYNVEDLDAALKEISAAQQNIFYYAFDLTIWTAKKMFEKEFLRG
jgi:hypothetical protein